MNNTPNNTQNKIEFNFTCYALKLLGHNLYSNPWTAVSEIVANGIDAKAKNVYVLVDLFNKETAQIEIIDNGKGMTYDDLCNKYTIIGRNKRLDNPDDKSILGRKGVGKLAALFLSDKYYLSTKSDNETSSWYVDVSGSRDEDIPALERFDGTPNYSAADLWEQQNTGTIIKLTNVNLKKIGPERLKALPVILSDYYLSDIIDCEISVCVRHYDYEEVFFVPVKKNISFSTMYAIFDNTEKGYMNRLQDSIYLTKPNEMPEELDCKHPTKKYEGFPSSKGTILVKNILGEEIPAEYNLTGWIGIHASLDSAIQRRNDESFDKINYHPNAIRLYVRGKLAVDNLMTYINNTQAFSNYIEGEICFDVLDDDRFEDISTSNREGYKKDDVRVKRLLEIVGKIVTKLINERVEIGSQINAELKQYNEKLRQAEEDARRKAEEDAQKAKEKAQRAQEAQAKAEQKQKAAEATAHRERRRSQYILNVSDVEDKNIMNSVHSIYNMSNRVKENLDEINNLVELSADGRKKLEKASTSNQRILSVSKLISKAGRVIDDNDAIKLVDLTAFIDEYVKTVLCCIYDSEDIVIECVGDVASNYEVKIKPLSFIMMIDNIIGNAIKAKAKQLSIIIDNSQPDCYSLIFKDNGNGIDSSILDINSLFEFGVTTTNGSGLGLYYAKKQMKELKGNISIEPNDGAGISVILSWKK